MTGYVGEETTVRPVRRVARVSSKKLQQKPDLLRTILLWQLSSLFTVPLDSKLPMCWPFSLNSPYSLSCPQD